MTPFVPERDGIDQEVPYLELEGVGSRGPVTGLGLEAAVMEIDLDVGVSAHSAKSLEGRDRLAVLVPG